MSSVKVHVRRRKYETTAAYNTLIFNILFTNLPTLWIFKLNGLNYNFGFVIPKFNVSQFHFALLMISIGCVLFILIGDTLIRKHIKEKKEKKEN